MNTRWRRWNSWAPDKALRCESANRYIRFRFAESDVPVLRQSDYHYLPLKQLGLCFGFTSAGGWS
jgi:hypothetical protein